MCNNVCTDNHYHCHYTTYTPPTRTPHTERGKHSLTHSLTMSSSSSSSSPVRFRLAARVGGVPLTHVLRLLLLLLLLLLLYNACAMAYSCKHICISYRQLRTFVCWGVCVHTFAHVYKYVCARHFYTYGRKQLVQLWYDISTAERCATAFGNNSFVVIYMCII